MRTDSQPTAPAPTASTIVTATRLAGLACLALLAEPLTGLADTAAAGHLGVETQASLAVGAGLVTTATWIVSPIVFAQTTQIARLRSTGRHGEAARLTRSALLAGALFGLVLAGALTAVALFAVDDDARSYVIVRAVGLPVTAAVLAGYGALRGSSAVGEASVLALIGAALHVGLDVVVVTRTSLGATGIAMASVLSQGVVLVIVLRRLRTRGLWERRGRSGVSAADGQWRGSAAAVAILAVRSAMLGGAALAMTAAAVGISPAAAAAHLVTYQCWLVVVLAVEAWKSAAQIMVSSTPSASARASIESALLRGSVVLGIVAGLIVIASAPLALSFVAADGEVVELARSIWPLSALSLVVGAVAFTRDGIEYGQAAFGRNLMRISIGTTVWLTGAGLTWLTGDLRAMWGAMSLGLLARAIWRRPTPKSQGTVARIGDV